jgi:hypothetical protein
MAGQAIPGITEAHLMGLTPDGERQTSSGVQEVPHPQAVDGRNTAGNLFMETMGTGAYRASTRLF